MQSDQLSPIGADMTSTTSLSFSIYNLLLYEVAGPGTGVALLQRRPQMLYFVYFILFLPSCQQIVCLRRLRV